MNRFDKHTHRRHHIADEGSFGKIVLGIGVTMLLQAQNVHVRTESLVAPAALRTAAAA